MRLMTNEELFIVAGGKFDNPQGAGDLPNPIVSHDGVNNFDAAATRQPGTNSYGEPITGGSTTTTNICVSASTGVVSSQVCTNSDNTMSVQVCGNITIGVLSWNYCKTKTF
ncbi:hypothetical protein ACO0K0_05300 [Undibacterium sp. SXout11W]|uniref:hypothetical protein n=1 Tax=Undibacterium sp. SXout11W TaxID=3413050 RepID=UPI003BF33903